MFSFLPSALCVLALVAVTSGEKYLNATAAGKTCFTEGNFLVRNAQTCKGAAAALGYTNVQLNIVPDYMNSTAVGGCFYETYGAFTGLWFNPNLNSAAQQIYDLSICETVGDKNITDDGRYERFGNLHTCNELGEEIIYTQEECSDVVTKLGLGDLQFVVVPTASRIQYPAGCSVDLYLEHVWYNPYWYSESRLHNVFSPVCQLVSKKQYVKPTPSSNIAGVIKQGGWYGCMRLGNNVITTIDGCRNAARLLGIFDSNITVVNSTIETPGCYYDIFSSPKRGLIFNRQLASLATGKNAAAICYWGGGILNEDFIQLKNDQTCSDSATAGYTVISTQQDCLNAARFLGYVFTEAVPVPVSQVYLHPAGCFISHTDSYLPAGLHYNPTGISVYHNVYESPICAAIKVTATGDYTRLQLDDECTTAGEGYRYIGTMKECQYAASELKLSGGVFDTSVESKFFRPRGCYLTFNGISVTVWFNDANQVNVTAADAVPICRIPKSQTYVIKPDQVGNEFYWGFNVWGAHEELEAVDLVPSKAIRMVRWGNLFPAVIESEDPPVDTSSISGQKALQDYIARAYGDRACEIKDYADALKDRDISIMAILFDIPPSYTQKIPINYTDTFYDSRILIRSSSLASYIAEAVRFLRDMLQVNLVGIELTNEPNGLWDAYVAPEQYPELVKETKRALAERGCGDVSIIGPGISDLGSSLECFNPLTNERLPTCYMQEIASDSLARTYIDKYSIHPWDDVYDTQHRGPSYLDEAFIKWSRYVNSSSLASGKQIISTEWGGINLNPRSLAGQSFSSAPQYCYINKTTEKVELNMGLSPLWAARAFATFLVLINSGVSDALYWSTRDNFWAPGCFGLIDRAGKFSVLMDVFGPFFKSWPKGKTYAVKRSWPNSVEGRTEDIVVASITDGCRVIVAAANIQDDPATLSIDMKFMVPHDVTSVFTINNGGVRPVISSTSLNTITLQSYAVMQITFDNPTCQVQEEAPVVKNEENKSTQIGYAAFLWIIGFLIAVSACYRTRRVDENKQKDEERGMYHENEESDDDIIIMAPQVITPILDHQKPWIARFATKLKFLILFDIILHAAILTEGGTTSGRFHGFSADYRQMGRLISDAWVYHAVRLGVSLVAFWFIKVTSEDETETSKRLFQLVRPSYLCCMLLLLAKAHLRISHGISGNEVQKLCWYDLTVSARVAGVKSQDTPDFWFWAMIVVGLLFTGAELFCFWKLSIDVPEKPTPRSPLSKPSQKKPMLFALNSMRFFAAIHIVIYHFNAGNNPINVKNGDNNKMFYVFASWGACQLTFFFMLSGFILAYQYGDKSIDQTNFWVGRFIRLYPLYLFSILLGLIVLKNTTVDAVDTTVIILALQKWVGPALNNINTPGWAVGPFLLMYAIFPTVRDIMKTVSYQKRTNVVLPLCFIGGAMSALDALNENWTGVFAPLNHIFLTAHFPSFLAGLVLGLNYLEAHEDESYRAATMRDVIAVPVTVLLMIVLFLTADLSEEHGNFPFWHEWARHGMLQPLVGILLWYGGRGHDFLSRALSWPPLLYFGNASFTIYLLQAPLFNFFANYLGFPYPLVDYECGAFLFMLVGFSLLVLHHVELPLIRVCSRVWASSGSRIPHVFDVVPSETPEFIKIIGYYCTMGSIFALFMCLALFGTGTILRWEGDSYAFDLTGTVAGDIVSVVKWLALSSLPVAVVGLTGQILFPPCRRSKVPSLEAMLDDTVAGIPHFPHKLHFRIVTRGKAPLLVLENVETAARVLESCLPPDRYELEVVTDNDMQLQSRTSTPVTEIVVPTSYKCPTGAKFKARALEYAIHNSSCTKDDWIVHQDEETRFEVETVQKVFHHCAVENAAIQEGKRRYGRIGQGVIVYGSNDEIENWVTTLADSIRVADDYGKFRVQFELHEPLIGMHGSFVVASQAVEEATTFDHGMAGSVTEDAYFALVARSLGVKFSFIDAYMYEQSPFSILDFAKQRKRWFAGLWLVAKAPGIPLKYRLGLFLLEIQWGWAPLMLPAAILVLSVKTDLSQFFRCVLAGVSAYWCWAYVVGFLFTFSIRKLGIAKWLVLLWLQLVMQPWFALLEVWGVGSALIDREAFQGFHVVQKESAALKQRMTKRSDAEKLLAAEEHYEGDNVELRSLADSQTGL